MADATLTARRIQDHPTVQRLDLDCRHGTTTALFANGPRGLELTDAMVTRAVLLKHAEEQPACRCIVGLWQQTFGCRYPEVKVA